MDKIVVDCSTEETTIVPLTAEEIAQREADAASYAAEKAARDAELAAKEATRQSALAKLAALGLTAEEAAAIAGS